MEECFGSPEVARLANAKLHQPGQAMLNHLTAFSVLPEGPTLLEASSLLE